MVQPVGESDTAAALTRQRCAIGSCQLAYISLSLPFLSLTFRFIYYRKSILQLTQPSQYRCTKLQYIFAVISEAPSIWKYNNKLRSTDCRKFLDYADELVLVELLNETFNNKSNAYRWIHLASSPPSCAPCCWPCRARGP